MDSHTEKNLVTEPVTVVAAVIRRDSRYLLGRRPDEKRHGGLWEFPGGKLLEGEDLDSGVRRELAEELGLEVVGLGPLVWCGHDAGSPFVIHFVEVSSRGEPTPSEHTRVGWFDQRALESMRLAPTDATFVRFLRESQSEA